MLDQRQYHGIRVPLQRHVRSGHRVHLVDVGRNRGGQLEEQLRHLETDERSLLMRLTARPKLERPIAARRQRRNEKLRIDEGVVAFQAVAVSGSDLNGLILAPQRL